MKTPEIDNILLHHIHEECYKYDYQKNMFEPLRELDIDPKQFSAHLSYKYGSLGIVRNFDAYVVDMWIKNRIPIWKKLKRTLEYEYNPTHNYDRTEEITVEHHNTRDISEHSTGNSRDYSESENRGESKVDKTSRSIADKSAINSVSAYNSTEFTPKEKTNGSESGNSSEADNTSGKSFSTGFSNGETEQKRNSGEIEGGKTTTTHRAFGNIGVTTTQEMIEAERQNIMFNMMDVIADEFKNTFLIMIY